jgi:hypothetical protein
MLALEELHGALVALGGFARGKGARLRVEFERLNRRSDCRPDSQCIP